MWDDRQQRTDRELGRADLAERFRVFDWSDLPEVRPMKFRTNEETLAEWAEQARAIELDEQLKNRGGIPPLPTTKVTPCPSK